jgi:phosphoglycerate dehydrogenase-like enzyme
MKDPTRTSLRILPPRFAILVVALTSIAAAADAAGPAPIAQIITELGLQESATPVRERRGWRPPRKIVIIGQRAMLADVAPGIEVVAVNDSVAARQVARDADIIVGLNSNGICDRQMIDDATELRWIMSLSAGVENCVGIPSVRSRDLLMTNMRAVESAAIGEHAIALALALARGIDRFAVSTRQARWSRQDAALSRVQTLHGKTLLVVGLGGIGTEVAERAHGIGMKVVATRASGRSGPAFVSYVGLPDELSKLASSADVIVNTAPLTSETTGLFNAKFFALLKPTALFINVARGKSVVTADLVDALNQGRLGGAGLDVVEPEPLPADHPLWRAPNVIVTPHMSGDTDVRSDHRWEIARENLRRYLAGGKLLSVVDLKREY